MFWFLWDFQNNGFVLQLFSASKAVFAEGKGPGGMWTWPRPAAQGGQTGGLLPTGPLQGHPLSGALAQSLLADFNPSADLSQERLSNANSFLFQLSL